MARITLTVMWGPFDPEAFGKRIALLRGGRKVSSLLAGTGISEAVWSRYENGRIENISVKTVERIAEVLGFPVWHVLGLEPKPSTADANNVTFVPLVAEDVAAGFGSWPTPPEPEFIPFLRSFAGLRSPGERRYAVFRLGTSQVASSMIPDLQPGSLVLVDRDEGRRTENLASRRKVPFLCRTDRDRGTTAVKDVHVTKRSGASIRQLVLTSRNPAFPPIVVDLERNESILEVVRARVIWWSTEPEL